jgi:hypothetical protein
VKDLYDKNLKSPKKAIEEDLRICLRLCLLCSWSGRINIVKYIYLAKSNQQIECNPHQNSNSILQQLERPISKFIWNNKNLGYQTLLNDKRTFVGITMPEVKLYYRAIAIKIAWYWYSHRQVDQWNRIEDPEMNPDTYGHLIDL